MSLPKRYANLKLTLDNVNQVIARRILEVLEREGSSILKAEHLKSAGLKVKLEDILILSESMKRSIKEFDGNIKRIANSDKNESGDQFYITDYGGSKTQFIELIINIINQYKERREPPFARIIPVIFNGSANLTATYLGEQIETDTARILTRQLEIFKEESRRQYDPHDFENFMNLLVNFRKAKNAPEHLKKIHTLLSNIEQISKASGGITMKISDVRQELTHLPLIDEESLLKIVFDIMEFASKYGIVYLFMYDECDDWLAKVEKEITWNENFLKRQYFFRKLFDNLSNFRLYQIFCFTPRTHETVRSEKSDLAPGIQRISSDMMKDSSIQIREQGVYEGDEAIEAVLKWLIILEKAHQRADNEIFNTFLPKLIEKIDNKLPRRKANSATISSIRAFINLSDDIIHGQSTYNIAEKHSKMYMTIGEMIEKTFSSYLNSLKFNFHKKHIDVGEGRAIDGQFMSAKGGEIELYAEIKSISKSLNFNYSKVEQAVNCVKNKDSRAIIFFFCKDLTDDYVKEKLHEWKNYGRIPSNVNLNNIIPIIFNDQTLLNCLVGLERFSPSQLEDKFEDFDKLVRLMNKDFHGKLTNLFAKALKIPEEPIKPPIIVKPPVIPLVEKDYSNLLKKLKSYDDTIISAAVDVTISLGNNEKVYTYRNNNVVKDAIKPLLRNSYNDAIEFLRRNKIINEKGDRIEFNWDYFDKADIKNDPESLMITIFEEFLKKIKS